MNFLIANKLWLIVIGALVGVMLGLGVEIWKLKGDIKDAKAGLARAQTELAIKEAAIQVSAANLGECNMRIDLQNAKFKEPNLLRRVNSDSPFLNQSRQI